jgi:WD40 repeat protein
LGVLYSFDGAALNAIEAPRAGALRYAAWAPDGSSALVIGNRGEVLRFTPPSSIEHLVSGVMHNLRGASWSPDGSRAIIAGNRGCVLVFDGASFRTIAAPTSENLRRAAWSPDGSCALIVGNGGAVLRYDAASDRLALLPGDRAHTMRSVAWRPDGAYALIGGYASRHAGYPRPYVIYRCDGRFVQGILATDDEDDAIAIDWRPGTRPARALILVTRSGEIDEPMPGKVVEYDGAGFGYRTVPRLVRAPAATADRAAAGDIVQLLGLGWHPSGEYALLCGERGKLLTWDGSSMRQVRSGVSDSLVGPFWQPAAASPIALLLRGPADRVYTV